jgi:hypothetical protein
MSALKNVGLQVQEFVYDFDVDGGAQGAINLHAKDGMSVLPAGAVIRAVRAKVLAQLTSGGAAVLSWGNGDDADGYSGAAAAVAGFTANALFNGHDNAAALLWDDTNDHALEVNVADALDGQFIFTIGTADLTAGRMVFMVDYYVPAAS